MKADQWMPLYVGDYLADTGHLSTEGHGAYLLLLMHQWRTGVIPSDPAEQARIVRLSGRAWRALSPSLAPFFTVTERGWQQMRLERIRTEQTEKTQRLADRARAAGLASAAARKSNSSSTQDALKPTEPEPEPDIEKKESPPTPQEGGVRVAPEKSAATSRPDPFDEFWKAYPRKTGKDAARKSYAQALKRGADPEAILAGLKRTQWDTREAGRFIAHPSTWLNQGRWQDEGFDPGQAGEGDDDGPRYPV